VVGDATLLRTETGSIGATVTQRTIGETAITGTESLRLSVAVRGHSVQWRSWQSESLGQ
jgi:hypothetical protein